MNSQRFIGLMSGTSLDGVDGVLCEFSETDPTLQTLAHVALPFADEFKQELLALNSPGDNELHRAALAANELARVYAQVVQQLLTQTNSHPQQIQAIGAHGQTVRHQPQAHDATGYTLQLNNPALLAELTGIAVVADFRNRDVAAGGQGAPLVPAFHAEVFAPPRETTAVLNLGGISNLTLISDTATILGFDCGPGNALMDHWCQRHTGAAYDRNGAWAATGKVVAPLLQAMQAEPFFAKNPPKSTGRDLFNPDWLAPHLALAATANPQDVQATLTELTAWSCAQALQVHGEAPVKRLLVCGGGALNSELMRRLQTHLPHTAVVSTETAGLPPLQVEAVAFAWLARQTWLGRSSNLPAVTGAQGPRVLGAIYPA